MYKFKNNSIVTGYLKQYLKSINLPTIEVWKPGMVVFINRCYLLESKIVRAKKTGTFSAITPENFSFVDQYKPNNYMLNLTRNLNIKSLNYDNYTHEYLGDYLRFYRDYYHINLMSMYNCFGGQTAQSLAFQLDSNIRFDSKVPGYKIFIVPVKLFQTYTIALDSDMGVEIFTGIYSNNTLLETVELNRLYLSTYLKKTSCRFKKPFLYTKLADISILNASKLINREMDLRLIIKIPIANKSSITILEGDYKNSTDIYFDTNSKIKLANIPIYAISDVYNSALQNEPRISYKSRLQLLHINDNVSYPFSDRLVEFLFSNVITPVDSINENIKKLQVSLASRSFQNVQLNYISNYGIWSNAIRNCLYDISVRNNLIDNYFDITGYFDKTLEQRIGGIQNGV